jgi:hypothetical protein
VTAVPVLQPPLADRVAAPLRAAVVWGMLVAASGAVTAALVGGVGWLATWVWALFGEGDARWPWGVVLGVAAVGAVLSIASSSWTAAGTASREGTGRATIAALGGAVALVAGGLLGTPVVLLAAATVAWSLAIPFDRWMRLVARLAPGAVVAAVLGVLLHPAPPLLAAFVLVLSYPVTALLIAAGDVGWRTFAWRRRPSE